MASPDVLLITDHGKARQIFAALEAEGVLKLRFAPTLSQGEEEISDTAPGFVFVQNRISGLSGDIIVRYLRGLLPDSAQAVVLAHDAAEAAEVRGVLGYGLDLSSGEEALKETVRNLVTGKETPQGPVAAAPRQEEKARDLVFSSQDTDPLGYEQKPDTQLWLIPLVIVLLCLPVASYQAGKSWGKLTAPKAAIGVGKTVPGEQLK